MYVNVIIFFLPHFLSFAFSFYLMVSFRQDWIEIEKAKMKEGEQ